MDACQWQTSESIAWMSDHQRQEGNSNEPVVLQISRNFLEIVLVCTVSVEHFLHS